jgi:hypothetical protein
MAVCRSLTRTIVVSFVMTRRSDRATLEGARAFDLMQIIGRPATRQNPWIEECLVGVCAVQRRRFPVGASPTRQTLQPEATGAVMEVTKWLKPSISVSRIDDSASVQEDPRNLPPIFADVDQQCHQSRWRMVHLDCTAPLRQRHAQSSSRRLTG